MGVIAPKDNIGKKQLDNRVQVEISGSHPLVVCSPLDYILLTPGLRGLRGAHSEDRKGINVIQ